MFIHSEYMFDQLKQQTCKLIDKYRNNLDKINDTFVIKQLNKTYNAFTIRQYTTAISDYIRQRLITYQSSNNTNNNYTRRTKKRKSYNTTIHNPQPYKKICDTITQSILNNIKPIDNLTSLKCNPNINLCRFTHYDTEFDQYQKQTCTYSRFTFNEYKPILYKEFSDIIDKQQSNCHAVIQLPKYAYVNYVMYNMQLIRLVINICLFYVYCALYMIYNNSTSALVLLESHRFHPNDIINPIKIMFKLIQDHSHYPDQLTFNSVWSLVVCGLICVSDTMIAISNIDTVFLNNIHDHYIRQQYKLANDHLTYMIRHRVKYFYLICLLMASKVCYNSLINIM